MRRDRELRKAVRKMAPLISPIQVEAYTLAQFIFVNFIAQPFIKNMLIAGKDCFDSQDYWPLMLEITEKRSQIAL